MKSFLVIMFSICLVVLANVPGCVTNPGGAGERGPAEDIISIISVNPPTGYAGTLVTIVVKKESDQIYLDNVYRLNGYGRYAERRSGDTLWIRIPYFRSFTGLQIVANDTRIDSTYTLDVGYTPIPEICSQPVCVKWYDADSLDEVVFTRYKLWGWNTQVTGDTVVLMDSLDYPDYEYKSYLTLLDHGKDLLPEFISFRQYERPGRSDTLKSGLLKIISWDPNGMVSGALFSSDIENDELRFLMTYFRVDLSLQ